MVTTVMCHRYEGSGVVGISNNRQCMLRTILRRYSSPPVSGSHPLTPDLTGPKVRFDTMVAALTSRENRIRIVLPDDKLADPTPRSWSPETRIQESFH